MDHIDIQFDEIAKCLEVISTSERGDRLDRKPDIVFSKGRAEGCVIEVFPYRKRQKLLGIGTSFTESAAFVLAHLEKEKREQVMQNIFSETGANFSLARTPIGSCDFCVDGKYSYAGVVDDMQLSHFDISADHDGFRTCDHPWIRDESFDLIPMIRQALSIKEKQAASDLRIIASAWTAPPWMKNIEDWYQPPSAENGFTGYGGVLKPGYESIYADYLLKYLDAYREQGIGIWGITPVNEPLGNNGQWESMHFTPESQKVFIRDHLGPRLKEPIYDNINLLIYDQNRDRLEAWMDEICSDPASAQYVDGVAVHWYESSFKVYENVFDRVHAKHPDCPILHTEGCIDNLGNDAPAGVLDPAGYKESGWFRNDAFWWNDNATDWAYSATWPGVDADDHPPYTPVHRYARNIIVSLNHWVTGWIDWNIVLDKRGGPNHAGNYCGAPIMIDTVSGDVYYTPVFFILAQFSRTIRPGDCVVSTRISHEQEIRENLYACATISSEGVLSVQILNTSKQRREYYIQIANSFAAVELDGNSLKTIRIRLSPAWPTK